MDSGAVAQDFSQHVGCVVETVVVQPIFVQPCLDETAPAMIDAVPDVVAVQLTFSMLPGIASAMTAPLISEGPLFPINKV